MDRLLITGARGQLGSDCLAMLDGKYELIAVDLPEVDLASKDACQSLLDAHQPDIILNCAAFTDVDGCEGHREACWPINAEVPGWLAGWARQHGRYLVHISTDFVFDGEKTLPEPYSEEDESRPVSVYGASKRGGEEAILEAGADCAIMRTAWLYGRTGRNFPKTMLRLSVTKPGVEIKVINDQFGSPTWSFDLAGQVERVLSCRPTGVLHASSEGHCTWYDFACRFLEAMGVSHRLVPCTTSEYPTPARRPANSILENRRLKDGDINVMRDWKAGLAAFVAEYKRELLEEAEGSKS